MRHTCKECRKLEPRPSLEKRRSYLRQKLYGLTDADFQALLQRQNGLCAICATALHVESQDGLHIDHCHDTGCVRGLLCGPCNAGIGHLRDSAELCRLAAVYLSSR